MRALELRDLSSNYGNSRLNSRSRDKSFKTVINVQSADQARRVLERISNYLDIVYIPENISITTGPRGGNIVRCDTKIGEWRPLPRVPRSVDGD